MAPVLGRTDPSPLYKCSQWLLLFLQAPQSPGAHSRTASLAGNTTSSDPPPVAKNRISLTSQPCHISSRGKAITANANPSLLTSPPLCTQPSQAVSPGLPRGAAPALPEAWQTTPKVAPHTAQADLGSLFIWLKGSGHGERPA